MHAPPAEPPYAYVVDYRPLDECAPPKCTLRSDRAVGWWSEIQEDGRRGAYFQIGNSDTEAYYRRAKVTRPGEVYQFALPAAAGEFEYDGYFASSADKSWQADFEVVDSNGALVAKRDFQGHTLAVEDAAAVEDMARYDDRYTHVRFSLPPHEGQPITVRIKNSGSERLAIGSPLVLRKVLGRKPRQAFFVFFDAVPEPLFTKVLSDDVDDSAKWLARAIRERGSLFAEGMSAGFNTPTFVRRFFRNGYYHTAGEPSLFGQGIDETPPPLTTTTVSQLSAAGVQSEAIISNFLMMPTQTRLGFDGGYQNEQQSGEHQHPAAIVRRFVYWLKEHPKDDVFATVWFSNTHDPFPPGREGPAFVLEGPKVPHSQSILKDIWKNLLVSVDKLKELLDGATKLAPDVDRLWLVGTDHGRLFTRKSLDQPWRNGPKSIKKDDCAHCCLGSFEETHTPFAVLYDGISPYAPPRIDQPVSIVAAWRLLERLFGAHLGLPETRTYTPEVLDPKAFHDAFDDGALAAAGDSGTIRVVRGSLAYRAMSIHPETVQIWKQNTPTQKLLFGTPNTTGYFYAEELYDRENDPFEIHNIADRRMDVVLDFRRRLTDWLAIYDDPPTHPRYEYTLEFSHPVSLVVEAPRPFALGVDGPPVDSSSRKLTGSGRKFVIRDLAEPVGVIDVLGYADRGFLRCAGTGLPLAVLVPGKTRINLALAQTNCVTSEGIPSTAPGDVRFSARLVESTKLGSGGVSSGELLEGLKRWGYVRDMDKP